MDGENDINQNNNDDNINNEYDNNHNDNDDVGYITTSQVSEKSCGSPTLSNITNLIKPSGNKKSKDMDNQIDNRDINNYFASMDNSSGEDEDNLISMYVNNNIIIITLPQRLLKELMEMQKTRELRKKQRLMKVFYH